MLNIKLPYSKSELNRLLVLGSQMTDSVTLLGSSQADDVFTMLKALSVLGCEFEVSADRIIITPAANGRLRPDGYIKINNSATGFRMLLALLATQPGGKYLLDASEQLRLRPMQPLVTALREMGAVIEDNEFPYKIQGTCLNGSNLQIDTSISSQYLSALLLVSAQCFSGLNIELTGTKVSREYVKMTISILGKLGIEVIEWGNKLIVPAGSRLINPSEIAVEPDYSCACYFWAMAALFDKQVQTAGDRLASQQPDAGFADLLSELGAKVIDKDGYTCVQGSKIKGIKVDMSQMPDQVPTLAVMGLMAASPMEITGISHLQYKESNRIEALITEIRRIGGRADYENDCLTVQPLAEPARQVTIETHGDHRLAMAFAILMYEYPSISINEPEVVNKSFPGFWAEYQRFMEAE
ncbi:MAG: 3-phosphoshikimate 1-carboxyvinyltransferase [Candidatus Cloacimonetes bacterium]|nr:3-phosphoshikimate 1-carboxyvinyltransferase [Candidatus Cloacimonadota bacterium]